MISYALVLYTCTVLNDQRKFRPSLLSITIWKSVEFTEAAKSQSIIFRIIIQSAKKKNYLSLLWQAVVLQKDTKRLHFSQSTVITKRYLYELYRNLIKCIKQKTCTKITDVTHSTSQNFKAAIS